MPELSIIIPTYNRVGRLQDCLQALAEQTVPRGDFEVVVVVDGATDGTMEMLAALPIPYALTTIYQENQGQQVARNTGAAQANGRYFSYYTANGVLQPGKLGVAWGSSRKQLANSATARSGLSTISVWGPGSVIKIDNDLYALFLNDVYAANGPTLEVRAVSPNTPANLSSPVQSYQFDNVWEAIVHLDEETNTWFMFYRSADHEYYGAKIASTDGRQPQCAAAQAYLPFVSHSGQTPLATDCAAKRSE